MAKLNEPKKAANITTKTSPWIRLDEHVDLHYDCEFVDDEDGFQFISIGAVIVGNKKSITFYGIGTEFFKSPKFFELISGKNKNSEFMIENVFKHISGTAVVGADHKKGTIPELAEILTKPEAVFTLDLDQTYPLFDYAGDEIPNNEPDIVVIGSHEKISKALHEATKECRATDKGEDNAVRQFTYYGSYDQFALCLLFGGMLECPEEFQHMVYDIRSIGDAFGYSHDDFNDETPHCAMSDAIVQYGMMQRLRNTIIKDYGDVLGITGAQARPW